MCQSPLNYDVWNERPSFQPSPTHPTTISAQGGAVRREYLPLPVQMAFHCLAFSISIFTGHWQNPFLASESLISLKYLPQSNQIVLLLLLFNCRNVCWINYSLVNKIKDELILGIDFLNRHPFGCNLAFLSFSSTHLFTFNCRRGLAGWWSQRLTKRAILIVVAVLTI